MSDPTQSDPTQPDPARSGPVQPDPANGGTPGRPNDEPDDRTIIRPAAGSGDGTDGPDDRSADAAVDRVPAEIMPAGPNTAPGDVVVATPGNFYADFPEQDDPETPPVAVVDEHTADAAPKRPWRRAGIVGARVVTGAVGIAIAVATISAASLLPLPAIGTTAPNVLVTPIATAQQLVCAGSMLRLSSESGQGATEASALGTADVSSASSEGPVTTTPLADSEAGTGGTASAPQLLSTPPSETDPGTPVLLSGAQAQGVSSGEFRGLAASGCAVASGESWLVGGSTSVGRTTLITLDNPSEVPATVNLEIFGDTGTVTSPGMTGIVVAPNGQRVLSLAGFAPEQASPVVHVESTGGQIVAGLQQSIVRGLEPGGVDIIGAGTAPATTTVIPGVVVSGTAQVRQRIGQDGYEDLDTVLRVFAPGTGTVTAQVNVIPENGAVAGTSFAIDFEAGRVTDLPIDDVADGSYTVTVDTSVPATAGVRVSTVGSNGRSDFAWLEPAQMLDADAQVTVSPNVTGAIHLYNPTAEPVSITLAALSGVDIPVAVPAGSAVAVAAASGATYRITGVTSLYAGVSIATSGGIAGYTASPAARSSAPVRVYP